MNRSATEEDMMDEDAEKRIHDLADRITGVVDGADLDIAVHAISFALMMLVADYELDVESVFTNIRTNIDQARALRRDPMGSA